MEPTTKACLMCAHRAQEVATLRKELAETERRKSDGDTMHRVERLNLMQKITDLRAEIERPLRSVRREALMETLPRDLRGKYEFIARFLLEKGAGGEVFSELEHLYKKADCNGRSDPAAALKVAREALENAVSGFRRMALAFDAMSQTANRIGKQEARFHMDDCAKEARDEEDKARKALALLGKGA